MKKITAIYNLISRRLRNIYQNPVIFFSKVIVSSILLLYLLLTLNFASEYNYNDFFIKNAFSFTHSWNYINGYNIFLSMITENVAFTTFPIYELITAFIAKITLIDLLYLGRIINLSLLGLMIFLYFKIVKTYQLNIAIACISIFMLCVNTNFALTVTNFHPEILNYVLILLSLYLYFNKKMKLSFFIIFILAVIKSTYAVTIISFYMLDQYILLSEKSSNRSEFLKKTSKEFLRYLPYICVTMVLILIINAWRNILMDGNLFALSIEGKNNLISIDKILNFSLNNIINILYAEQSFVLLFSLIYPLILFFANRAIFIRTLSVYIVFLLNMILFPIIYIKDGYGSISLCLIFSIFVFNYNSVLINKFMQKICGNKKHAVIFLSVFMFAFVNRSIYLFDDIKDVYKISKNIYYVKNFVSYDKKILVINDEILNLGMGFPFIDKKHKMVSQSEFKVNCNKYINEYDVILLIDKVICIKNMLLSNSDVLYDNSTFLWLRNEIKINKSMNDNFYIFDKIINIDAIKIPADDIKNSAIVNEDISFAINDNNIYLEVKNCLSKNYIQKKLAFEEKYNLFSWIKESFHRFSVINNKMEIIDLVENTIITNDICYKNFNIDFDFRNVKLIEG